MNSIRDKFDFPDKKSNALITYDELKTSHQVFTGKGDLLRCRL